MTVRGPVVPMPGARLGWEPLPDALRPRFEALRKLAEEIGGPRCLRWLDDPDCLGAFLKGVPDRGQQERYVTETARFVSNENADMDFVLIFRRSLPKDGPAPEKFWTSEYITAVRGLRREIPPPHRWFTVILCGSLGEVMADGTDATMGASSDGEIQMRSGTYDQRNALFSFRTSYDEAQLRNYSSEPGALTLEFLHTELKRLKEQAASPSAPRERTDIARHKDPLVAPESNQVQAGPLARHLANKRHR